MYKKTGDKQVYYFSMEFLWGRLLVNCLLNLGIRDMCKEALGEMGIDVYKRQEYSSYNFLDNNNNNNILCIWFAF